VIGIIGLVDDFFRDFAQPVGTVGIVCGICLELLAFLEAL
jgi:hypothetical protein